MRLLVISINYAPEIAGSAPYTTGVSEHMAALGHEVHVLTGLPHYPSWRRGPEDGIGGVEIRNGVRIYRRWHYVPPSQSAVQRAFYEGTFLSTGAFFPRKLNPDAIVAVVPALSDGILARWASRRFGAPYGVLFQDLMGRATSQSGITGPPAVEKLVHAGESWAAKDASAVAIVAEGFRSYVESLGVDPGRIQRVRNWNHMPQPSAARQATRRQLGWQDETFVCLHAGNMGLKQDLENVLGCAQIAACSQRRLLFVFAGDGNQRQRLQEVSRQNSLENVQFIGSLETQAYIDLLEAADVLILNQRAGVKDMSFPSKLASYVSSRTPIIAAVSAESDVARELAAARSALLVQPGQPDELLDGITLLAVDTGLRRALVTAAKEYGDRSFSPHSALKELELFVGRITGNVEAPDEHLREAA